MNWPKILLVAFLSLLVASSTAAAAVIEFPDSRQEADKQLETLAAAPLPYFGVEPSTATVADVTRRMESLAETSAPLKSRLPTTDVVVRETDEEVIATSGSVELASSKLTGSEYLLDLSRYAKTGNSGPQSPVLSDVDLKAKADAYVAKNLKEVAPDQLRFDKIVKIVDAVARYHGETGEVDNTRTRVGNCIALFSRVIGGVPVIGPGERVRVYFAANGDVIGHSKIWRRLQPRPLGSKSVVTPDKFKKLLIEAHLPDAAGSMTVERISLGYLAGGRHVRQKYLKPAYMVEFAASARSKQIVEFYDAYSGERIDDPSLETDPGDSR